MIKMLFIVLFLFLFEPFFVIADDKQMSFEQNSRFSKIKDFKVIADNEQMSFERLQELVKVAESIGVSARKLIALAQD